MEETMSVKQGGLVLIFAAALSIPACVTTDRADPTEQTEQALKSANLDDVDVEWDEDARIAHLKGTVPSTADRQRAEMLATEAVGTTGTVVNELTVKGLNDSTADNLDGRLRSELERKVNEDQVLRDRDIDFEINNGAVTIKGEVRTAAEKDRVTDMVKATPGVKDMANGLEIAPKN
jgi:osmotically-inducible protein OsmY